LQQQVDKTTDTSLLHKKPQQKHQSNQTKTKLKLKNAASISQKSIIDRHEQCHEQCSDAVLTVILT